MPLDAHLPTNVSGVNLQAALRELQQVITEGSEAEDAPQQATTEQPLHVKVEAMSRKKSDKSAVSKDLHSQSSLNRSTRPGSGTWKQLQKRSSQNLRSIGQIFK